MYDQMYEIQKFKERSYVDETLNNFLQQRENEYQLHKTLQLMMQQSEKRLQKYKTIDYNPKKEREKRIALLNNVESEITTIKRQLLLSNDYYFDIYQEKDFPEDELPDLVWGVDIDYKIGEDVQMLMSTFPNIYSAFYNKIQFYKRLKEFDEKSNYKMKSKDFYSQTYILYPLSKEITQSEQDLFDLQVDPKKIYIEKLPNISLGRGLTLHKNITNFITDIKKCKFNLDDTCLYEIYRQYYDKKTFDSTTLLQEYVSNPLLLGNRKFNIRSQNLCLFTGSYFICYFYNMMLTRSNKKYEPDSLNEESHITHIVDKHVKEYHSNKTYYDALISQQTLTPPEFEELYIKEYNVTTQEFKKLIHKQKQVLTYSLLAGLERVKYPNKKMPLQKGQFHMLGCDTMFDDQKNPWVTECNTYPSILINYEKKKLTQPQSLKALIDIIMYFHENWDEMDEIAMNPEYIPNGVFEEIYNEGTGYNILNEEFEPSN